jgi:DNA end-binding protein Ku
MRGREYVVSLKPCGKGMVLETLRYADEVNKAAGYFRDIEDKKPDEDLLDLAETLIKKKTAPFDPREFHDRYVEALHDLIGRKLKLKGAKIKPEKEPAPTRGSNVIDLMAALKRSIEKPGAASGSARKPASGDRKPAVRRTATSKAAPKRRAARG